MTGGEHLPGNRPERDPDLKLLREDWSPASPPPSANGIDLHQTNRKANPPAEGNTARAPLQTAAPDPFATEPPATQEEWIERLLRLGEKGDQTEFARERAEFRAACPEFSLPPELED